MSHDFDYSELVPVPGIPEHLADTIGGDSPDYQDPDKAAAADLVRLWEAISPFIPAEDLLRYRIRAAVTREVRRAGFSWQVGECRGLSREIVVHMTGHGPGTYDSFTLVPDYRTGSGWLTFDLSRSDRQEHATLRDVVVHWAAAIRPVV